MKRYHLFAGHDYYPRGGFADHQGVFATIEEAINHFGTLTFSCYVCNWGQVVDIGAGVVVVTLSQQAAPDNMDLRDEVEIDVVNLSIDEFKNT